MNDNGTRRIQGGGRRRRTKEGRGRITVVVHLLFLLVFWFGIIITIMILVSHPYPVQGEPCIVLQFFQGHAAFHRHDKSGIARREEKGKILVEERFVRVYQVGHGNDWIMCGSVVVVVVVMVRWLMLLLLLCCCCHIGMMLQGQTTKSGLDLVRRGVR